MLTSLHTKVQCLQYKIRYLLSSVQFFQEALQADRGFNEYYELAFHQSQQNAEFQYLTIQ
jgi:hypothetical protein